MVVRRPPHEGAQGPRRLAAHQLSILQVREALARQNADVPGGRVDEGRHERALRTLGRVAHSRDFPNLVVATVNGTSVRLSDLGEVLDATKEVRTLARLNGKPAVVLRIQRQSGENTVAVIKGIKVGLLGSFRHALFTSDRCAFHPSMANVDGEIDWAWGESLVIRGGLGVYQFFGLDTAPYGPWPSQDEKTAPHVFLGARYQWKKHIALLANYRRFFYAGGLNQLVFALEASLGEL